MDGKQRRACIAAIAALPEQLRALTDGMSPAQLTAHPLRAEAGWDRTGVHLIMGRVTLEGFLKIYADHGAAHIEQIACTKAALKGKPKPKARQRRAG